MNMKKLIPLAIMLTMLGNTYAAKSPNHNALLPINIALDGMYTQQITSADRSLYTNAEYLNLSKRFEAIKDVQFTTGEWSNLKNKIQRAFPGVFKADFWASGNPSEILTEISDLLATINEPEKIEAIEENEE